MNQTKNTFAILAATALTVASAAAKDAFELVNDNQGYSYIQINENIDSFTFNSDFKSIGNSGKIGFFIYPDGLEGQALKDYIASAAADDAQFGKKVNGGLVDLGSLNAGDRVGFYLERKNGNIVREWNFEDSKGTTYISFGEHKQGKNEWMSFENAAVTVTGGDKTPTGQPLPGALAMLALGGIGAGIAKIRSKKKTA